MIELNTIYRDIENKTNSYKEYDFTKAQSIALKAFFDLAQEYDHIDDLYELCVAIVKGVFGLEARLFLTDQTNNKLCLFSSTRQEEKDITSFPYITLQDYPYAVNDSSMFPIKGKEIGSDVNSDKINVDSIGILEVYPNAGMTVSDEFFFEKYANRIGFNIHNRILAVKNIEHIRFIKSLVADIEHNIIVPNMIFKLFLRRLNGKIMKNIEIERLLKAYHELDEPCDTICVERIMAELSEVNLGLFDELQNIQKHYENTSLFLETLLRKSHFDKGHLTVRKKPCNMKKDIIEPQLERYTSRFLEMNIEIRDKLDSDKQDAAKVLDLGLMAQVYANLFSNALKYTESVTTETGEKLKYVEYSSEILKDYFGSNKDGEKYNVFSTGQHIKQKERERIFEEGYRGTNTTAKPGTGHGLTFIKNAVHIHSGIVGYESLPFGNNFFFILPI